LDDISATLVRGQVDFDIMPSDTLEGAEVTDGRLVVNQETYKALVVPWAAWLPERVKAILRRLSAAGLPVLECRDPGSLAAQLRALGCAELVLAHAEPDLLYHHIRRGGQDVWMFFNQNPLRAIDVWLPLASAGCCFYDAWENRLTRPQADEDRIRLMLPPSGAVFVLGKAAVADLPAHDYGDEPMETVDLAWSLSLREAGQTEFAPYRQGSGLGNLARDLPKFCGTIRYEATFSVSRAFATLDLGDVGETGELWVNGEYCGAKISPAYRFRCAIRPGENRLVVEVVNNPAYRERDDFSRLLPLPPTGLVGPVRIG
jgi:hypothetical protein